MRRRTGSIICALATLCLVLPAFGVEPDEMLGDRQLEARARALTKNLRCVVCQNQSVDDSDAPLAQDIRVIVRERIAAGESDEQVLDFVVQRYGKFVLLNPPLELETVIIWIGPFVLFLSALGLAAFHIRRDPATVAPAMPLTSDEERDIERRIKGGTL